VGIFFAGLIGFAAGVALTAVFWRAFTIVAEEEALNPLADLNIEKEQLSSTDVKSYIDELAQTYLPKDGGGLAIAVIGGGESNDYIYGLTTEGGTTPDEHTLFEIASAGKTLTALVLADMVLKEEVALSDPIDQYLPDEVKPPTYQDRSIRLVDLATHSAGLPSLTENFRPVNPLNPYKDFTVDDLYAGVEMVNIESPIGKTFAYSNVGFGLLGHLLALKTETDYEDLIVDRICDPLGMDSTRMTLDDDLKSRLAMPHDGGKQVEVWEDTTLAGAGSFLSTPHDMLLYLQAHWDEENPLYESMQLAIRKRRPTDTPATAIGLSWFTDSENALDIVWHNGGAGGSRSYIGMIPDRQVGAVILSNTSSTSVEDLGKKVLYLLLRQADAGRNPNLKLLRKHGTHTTSDQE